MGEIHNRKEAYEPLCTSFSRFASKILDLIKTLACDQTLF